MDRGMESGGTKRWGIYGNSGYKIFDLNSLQEDTGITRRDTYLKKR